MREESAVVTFRRILNLQATQFSFIVTTLEYEPLWTTDARLSCSVTHAAGGGGKGRVDNFSCLAVAEKRRQKEFQPAPAQLAKFPLVLLAYVSWDAAIFAAGAVAGAAAKIVTAPLDRIKMLMQVLFLLSTFEFLHVFHTFFGMKILFQVAPYGLLVWLL